MKYLIIAILLFTCCIALAADSMTLKQVSVLWLVDGWNFKDYAVWAKNYGKIAWQDGPSDVYHVWDWVDGQWIFEDKLKYDRCIGPAERTISTYTTYSLINGEWRVQCHDVNDHIRFKPAEVLPVKIDPIPAEEGPTPEEQAVISLKGLIASDPNNAPILKSLLKLVEPELETK